ncbi:hypothetical protein [Priestia megaterium]|uniref:hypothetical protein n=1 Tax=Priestia megaterium TaxID=1404 RepID=UPI000E2EA364|nr:hypothetical protein [Priestia megaterium]MCM3021195.1 hypothetical protein [Priestia megaterium]MCM3194707.1 hypothetical protein [Priestia megaterium]
MSKYIGIFFLNLFIGIILYFYFVSASLLMTGDNAAEEAINTFGFIIIVFLSFLIAQMYYLIHLVKKK